MNVAIIARFYPYPPDTGTKIDNFYLIKALIDQGNKVHLFTFDAYSSKENNPDPLEKAGLVYHSMVKVPKIWKHYSNWLFRIKCLIKKQAYQGAWENKYLNQIVEIIQREKIDVIYSHKDPSPIFLDFTVVPVVVGLMEISGRSMGWQAGKEKNPLIKFWRRREAEAYLDIQLQEIKKFNNRLYLCSREEISWAEARTGADNVRFIPYGVDTRLYSPDNSIEEELLIGSIGNKKAFGGLTMASIIFPQVCQQFADARLLLLGGLGIHSPIRKIAQDNQAIELPGYLGDDDFIAQAKRPALYAFPIEYATGTKNSVLMAMALGKAVVGTRYALAGVDIEKTGAIVRDTNEEISSEIVRLLGDKEGRIESGKKNREYVVNECDWNVFTHSVIAMLKEAIKSPIIQENKI